MSGVYIPGFKKPTSQEQCKFFDYAPFRADYCVLFNTCKGADSCPLIPVPDHGRLVDADALEELFREVIGNISKRDEIKPVLEHMVRASAMAVEMIKDAPTIIPEEVSE